LCGCNPIPVTPDLSDPDGTPEPAIPTLIMNTLDVSVVPPAGLPMPTKVNTVLGSADVATGIAPQTPIFDEGPQFAMAANDAGDPHLLGFVGPGADQLNTHTTAEVLLFFHLNAPLLPGADQERVLAELKELPAVQTLADAIGAALAADVQALAKRDGPVQNAVRAARTDIMGAEPKPHSSTARLLIDPSDARSGLTVTQLGLTSINIRNDFRRRAHYFLEVVSFVPEGGGESIPSPLDVSEKDISPTTGATSFFGAINDIITGTQAYVAVDSGAIDLPILPETAESTTYKLTIVGPGANAGDDGMLSSTQRATKNQLILKSFVFDFFLPYFVDIIIPINARRIEEVLGREQSSELAAGLISALGNVADKALAGDIRGALYDLYTNIVGDGSTRLLFLNLIYEFLIAGRDYADQVQFTEFAEKALRTIDLADSVLVGIDALVQVSQIRESDQANIWTIVSDRSKVKLTPPQAEIDELHSQVFIAEIPDATGTDATIVYRWSTSGAHGGIRDNQHDGNEFDSTEKVVTYFPRIPVSAGQDTITVEAFAVRGQNRNFLGKATATIKVRELLPTITPEQVTLVCENGRANFNANVDRLLATGGTLTYGTLTYKWYSTSNFGRIVTPPPLVETPVSSATYQVTGSPPGADSVAVEVFSTKDGVKTSLGVARAQVKIEERKTVFSGSFKVETQFAQPGFTGTPGFQFVTAYVKVPKVECATSYSVRIYNFYDGLYWGSGTTFGDGTVRSAEDRGNEYWIGLTGGQARDGQVAETVAQAESRFVGILVEVTLTY